MSTVIQADTKREGGDGGDGDFWELGVDAWTSPSPAVQGVSRGKEGWTGGPDGEALANLLGWFSVALGAAQILAPGGVARLAGIAPGPRTIRVLRAAGLREIGHGVGILTNPGSKEWVATRVGGDVLDLALLGVALMGPSERRNRTAVAALAVLGVTALDVLCVEKLTDSRRTPTPEAAREPGAHVRRTITVMRPIDEVYAFWRSLHNLPRFMRHLESVHVTGDRRSRWRVRGPGGVVAEWDAEVIEERHNELLVWQSVRGSDLYNAGVVHFRNAPGGRGTEVTVEMHYAPPGGRLGAAFMKLFRSEPSQLVADDLRRFKQVMETGDVVVSDATALPGPHAARPTSTSEATQSNGEDR